MPNDPVQTKPLRHITQTGKVTTADKGKATGQWVHTTDWLNSEERLSYSCSVVLQAVLVTVLLLGREP